MRVWISTTALLALAACSTDPPAPVAEPAAAPAAVRTVVLAPESVQDEVLLPAELEPRRRATLAAEAAGRVERVAVDLGDRVAAGQALVVVDRRTAEEELAGAVALERQARLQRERAEALLDRQSITKAQLLDAVTNHEVARSRLDAAKLGLARTTVVAPWAGEVAASSVEAGDFVSPGQPLLELVDRSSLIARAPVPAADAAGIGEDSAVAVVLSSRTAERIAARLVRRAPAIDPSTRTLTIEAELAGDVALPGEPARLALVRRVLDAALLVPLTALVELEHSQAVYVVEQGVARRRPVRLGPVIGERVVIEEGLAAGDQVIVGGQDRVSDGQPVVVASQSRGAA